MIRLDDLGQPRGLATAVVAFLLVIGFAATRARAAGQIIENAAKPRAANAGRVIVPEEVLVISDEGTSDFYFKRPGLLRLAPGGSLVLRDENQVLLFDSTGRFKQNFFKKGQGPGEVSYVSDSLPTENHLIVHSAFPDKIIFFEYSGRYKREIKAGVLPGSRRAMARIILALEGSYLLQSRDFPEFKGNAPYFEDVPETILSMDDETGEVRALQPFPTKKYALAAPDGGGATYDITALIAVPFKEKFLALVHSEEYLVKIFDPAANKILREFRRTYARVKPEPLTKEEKEGGAMIGNKPFRRPVLEFQNDIQNILTRDGEIWAMTSTKDKSKGVLIDTFDGEGIYQDCFWLNLPEAARKSLLTPGQCVLDGEFLWVVERTEDETFTIKKYRVAI
jgi:6-bladed beta-propeller